MRIAVWRYGLSLQMAETSTVGGGCIARHIVKALTEIGDVTAVGNVSKKTLPYIEAMGVKYDRQTTSLNGKYDVAVILVGPANGCYPGFHNTYKRLDGFDGIGIYMHSDHALDFHFNPQPFKGTPIPSPTAGGAKWYLCTQLRPRDIRRRRSKASAYSTTPFTIVPTLFDMVQIDDPHLPLCRDPEPALAYFGSDRPTRIRAIKQWFCAKKAPPIHIYGRWSKQNKEECKAPNITFFDPVYEAEVVSKLNNYLGTIFITDKVHDNITRRLFENAVAGVPVVYVNPLLPRSVRKGINDLRDPYLWNVTTQDEIYEWFRLLRGSEDFRYMSMVATRALIPYVIKHKNMVSPAEALRGILNAETYDR